MVLLFYVRACFLCGFQMIGQRKQRAEKVIVYKGDCFATVLLCAQEKIEILVGARGMLL